MVGIVKLVFMIYKFSANQTLYEYKILVQMMSSTVTIIRGIH